MRTKKALLNSIINLFNYGIMILPNFFIRKLFIVGLGTQILGLNSLYQNIVGLLCVSELGLSLAISYALYKPLADNNRSLIKGYISYYIKFYRRISFIIMGIGIILMPFIHIFTGAYIPHMELYFFLFLLETCITYLFSAKFCLLSVSQDNYIITSVQTLINLISTGLQIVILIYYPNFFIFLIIMVIFKAVQIGILNIVINKRFKWIKNEIGILEKEKIKDLYLTMKGLFYHKISAMVVFSSDNIVISTFLGLTTVANFGNYYLVISGFQTIMIKIFDGITASIGNLVIENRYDKSHSIFKKSFFISFVLVTIISICILNSINIFIDMWVGKKYFIDTFSIWLIVMNFYFLGMRLPIEKFKEVSGLYLEDRYWAVFQAILNIILSIILVNIIGLPGVFLGTVISNYSSEFWIKPIIVYREVFKISSKEYFLKYLKYFIYFFGIYFIVRLGISSITAQNILIRFILVNFISISISSFSIVILSFLDKDFSLLRQIIKRIIKI